MGFFVPNSEYLKDPSGHLNYVGLKGIHFHRIKIKCCVCANIQFNLHVELVILPVGEASFYLPLLHAVTDASSV